MPKFTAFFTAEDRTKPLNILHDIISKFDQVRTQSPTAILTPPPKKKKKIHTNLFYVKVNRRTD